MNILILSATTNEIAPMMSLLKTFPGKQIDVLISGIGSVATAYHLTRQLHLRHYDLVIHAGIAGSFSDNFPPGSVVQIAEDVFAALGVETPNTFETAHSLGFYAVPGNLLKKHDDDLGIAKKKFIRSDAFPYIDGFLVNPAPPLPGWEAVRGITADTVSGSESTIGRLKQLFQPQIETMESAACFYVCISRQQNFHSIRSISNKVAPRNRNEWKTGLAIESLHTALHSLISGL